MKPSQPDPQPATLHLIVAEGGVSTSPAIEPDPYRSLDELMVVVEALCPKWPERDLFTGEEEFKL